MLLARYHIVETALLEWAMVLPPGSRVVVRTPDRRQYRGVLLAVKMDANGRQVATVRLDTGWETTYPTDMIEKESRA